MENVKNIDDFVKAVNSAIDSKEDLKQALNKAVEEALPKDEVVDKTSKKKYFDNLEAFENFLPDAIKNFFNEENCNKLGVERKGFEIKNIQGEDLEKLYKINLEPKTKTAIIKKFNIFNKTGQRLSSEEDIKKALSTFKKILDKDGDGKIFISFEYFYEFIKNNIHHNKLSKKALDDILDCVVEPSDQKNKLDARNFINFFNKFKEQPSEKFIDFMVKNIDFDKIKKGDLFAIIYTLVTKHSKYQQNINKTDFIDIMKDILNRETYQSFSNGLLHIKFWENIDWNSIDLNNVDPMLKADASKFLTLCKNSGITIKQNGNSIEINDNSNNIETEVSVYNIVVGTLLALPGIGLLGLSFLAPGIVIPVLTSLLPIISSTVVKIVLPIVVSITLEVIGIVLIAKELRVALHNFKNNNYKSIDSSVPGKNQNKSIIAYIENKNQTEQGLFNKINNSHNNDNSKNNQKDDL